MSMIPLIKADCVPGLAGSSSILLTKGLSKNNLNKLAE